LFKTVLKRHDYRQYINERLAGDFACTLAQHFEDVKAREQALQLRLNAADERADLLEVALRAAMDATAKSQTERDHQIPGTSGMRLNTLANQGE
jgi:hypothetical protein